MTVKLSSIKLGNRLKIYTANGLVIGTVVDIIPANVWPISSSIQQYYGITIEHEYYRALYRAMPVDRIILAKDNGSYFVLPRTEKVDRYLFDVQLES